MKPSEKILKKASDLCVSEKGKNPPEKTKGEWKYRGDDPTHIEYVLRAILDYLDYLDTL